MYSSSSSRSKQATYQNRGSMFRTNGSNSVAIMNQFVTGLKNKNEEVRCKAARDLYHYVTTELREVPVEELSNFMDEFNHLIFDMVSSHDVNERKGAILAIESLIGVDVGNTSTRISRFANYLRNTFPSNDVEVMELAAKAVGKLALVSGTYSTEYIDVEVKRAFEWLSASERHEGKRLAAVLVLKELAVATPTFFFQQVQQFFDVIFNAVRDPKPNIREGAVKALRHALIVTAQREKTQTQTHYYKQCFEEAKVGFIGEQSGQGGKEKGITKDDRCHGSMLVLNELLRCSNAEWERQFWELREKLSGCLADYSAGSGGAASLGRSAHQLTQDILSQFFPRWKARRHAGKRVGGKLINSSSSPGISNLSLGHPGIHLHHSSMTDEFNTGIGSGAGDQTLTFTESMACKTIVSENFLEICRQVLEQRNSRSPYVQQALFMILPRLAAFNQELFCQAPATKAGMASPLSTSMNYLLQSLRNKERSDPFITIGLLSIAVDGNIKSYLPKIMEFVRSALPSKIFLTKETPRKNLKFDPSIFTCLTLLSISTKSAIREDILEMLDSMLATGLSPALTTALREIQIQIPSLKKEINDGLLKILSQILMNQPWRHPGMPKNFMQTFSGSSNIASSTAGTVSTNISGVASGSSSGDSGDNASVVLALETLAKFDVDGNSVIQFVKHCADVFLTSDCKEIRLEAVRTCSTLLRMAIQGLEGRYSHTVTTTVADVLNKLLVVGITDSDPEVRFSVLENLDEIFDSYLSQPENLSALFVALHDEVFEIREIALCTIGRLSLINPAYVLPGLRKVLVQILNELEYSGMGRNKEQAARMLGHLVSTSPKLMKSYKDPVLKALMRKLKDTDPNPGVVINILVTLGDLAQVAGKEMYSTVPDLLTVLLDMLNDSGAPTQRGFALWTLGQLVENTGSVVTPYQKFPTLLDTLLSFLKTEQQHFVRRGTIRVLGLLGALDPYKHKMHLGQIDVEGNAIALVSMTDPKSEIESVQEMSTSEMLIHMSNATLDEFYPSIAIATLMRIIRDNTLAQHHTSVVQAVTFVFKSLNVSCVTYIPQVIPCLIQVIRTTEMQYKDFLFQQLGMLIAIVKQHIRSYLDDIFTLIKEFWMVNPSLQVTIILVVEQIAIALGSEFKVYLAKLIPLMLKVLVYDISKDRVVTANLLNALQKFGTNLDEFLHLLLPPIVKLLDNPEVPLSVKRIALETIEQLSCTLNFSDFASRIVHPLVRTLDVTPELRDNCMDTLASLVIQFGPKFQVFTPMVQRILKKHNIKHSRYDTLVLYKCKDDYFSEGDDNEITQLSRIKQRTYSRSRNMMGLTAMDTYSINRFHVSTANLQRAWTASRRVSKEDWLEWMRRLSIEFLKESPSPSLRACHNLAQTYAQLPRDLFNAAFVSCWTELQEEQQNELIASLRQALMVDDLPEITQIILNLAEFMEHCDKGPLPLEPEFLGERAMSCCAYAKALHYKEEQFHKSPSSEVLETLISINNKLQNKEASAGLLEYAMKNYGNHLRVQEQWYEKLHDWEKALELYRNKLETNPGDIDLSIGQMRCLEALGDWQALEEVARAKWPTVADKSKNKIAHMGAAASWGLNKWDRMEKYVQFIPRDSLDGTFYRALIAIHKELYAQAEQLIDSARDILDTELTAMASESYQRAYNTMVIVQMLAELEEVIQFKVVPERREDIKLMWWERLKGCVNRIEDWQKILQTRSVVLSKHDDIRTYLKFASLCRKNGRLKLSEKTLVSLLGQEPDSRKVLPTTYPQVTYAFTKHLWASGDKTTAFWQLQNFVKNSLLPQLSGCSVPCDNGTIVENSPTELRKLLARCCLRLGEWQENLEGLKEGVINQVLKCYNSATEYDPSWYKAWHAYAYMNFEAVLYNKNNSQNQAMPDKIGLTPSYISQYTIPAVQGFVRSIALSRSTGSSLQDTLRLLTLWFDFGHWHEVHDALAEGIRGIHVDTWLQVIPQLIARIDTPRHLVAKLIHHLLADIGKYHPQSLIYPLTVASKSSSPARLAAANKILKNMCEHSHILVQQAMMVSEELIRVAILWHELWHEGLEEASRLYFGERNVQGMFQVLEPLHAMLERGPQTLKETSFNQAYGRDLTEALEWCKRYKISGNLRDLNQAWDLYYHVFKRISRQLPQLISLELQYVSPKLLKCRDLELAVPGSYVPGRPVIQIAHIQSLLQVITSKQRPRKLHVTGSNGKEFVYAVIPLSTNSGLIGWVPHCDTLHTLIHDYREKKKILLNIEHRIMLRMAPDYDHLTLTQKVEVFEHALEHTQGDDLAKLLWLKSPSSEVWFDRRTNYTRSLAVMSMVGYVLGLGDRHPSNLMLDRESGKIVHIDFGDCFEVAMTREKYPEKIPFRLTRMLINAMEITGIDGTYRCTCESVMKVLRHNKDSLMAVLEAFVYDPLLNWRLIDNANATKSTKRGKAVVPHQSMAATATTVHPSSGSLQDRDGSDTLEITSSDGHPTGTTPAAVSKKVNPEADNTEKPQPEALNKKALDVVTRVREKLTGKDFQNEEPFVVKKQVDLLIQQATSHENLCQCYIGWCPFW
ncbi:Serine/threonine-protein kinase mTOR [Folsomia candida]|uniref:Serine/threonine-protein kinase TOR n=1 Tax=Folsomia candida TaxID=158441 RepID=A0A226E3Q1_FOLCA|nr:Serine/threonine-protein kinase mTOR [Folsomia candida]